MNDLITNNIISEINEIANSENTRVSSSTNVDLNKKVFNIVKQAIPIIEKIESFCYEIEVCEQKIAFQLSSSFWDMKHGIVATIVAILWSQLLYLVVEHYYEVAGWDFEPMYEMFPMTRYLNWKSWLLGVIIIYVVAVLIAKKNKAKYDERFCSEMKDQISVLEKQRDDYINDNIAVLSVIPPNGISSSKLKCMYELYSRGQADNLKEALNLADTKEYRDNETYLLKGMVDMMSEIMGSVRRIEYWW